MRFVTLAAALVLTAGPAFAQTTTNTMMTPTTTTPAAPAAPAAAPGTTTTATTTTATTTTSTKAAKWHAKFEAANTTHDGHLTLDQAKAAKWKGVVKNFDAIDTDKKGYVTEDDISSYHAAKKAAKKSAQ